MALKQQEQVLLLLALVLWKTKVLHWTEVSLNQTVLKMNEFEWFCMETDLGIKDRFAQELEST